MQVTIKTETLNLDTYLGMFLTALLCVADLNSIACEMELFYHLKASTG